MAAMNALNRPLTEQLPAGNFSDFVLFSRARLIFHASFEGKKDG